MPLRARLWRRPARAFERAHARGAAALLRDRCWRRCSTSAAVRWATANRLSLYGLGIPPAQYEALAGGSDMREVLRSRRRAAGLRLQPRRQLLRLAGLRPVAMPRRGRARCRPICGASISTRVRARVDRVEVLNRSITEYLAGCPDASRDRYVLLDAQDWMTDAQLNALWAEITRTARPGARVIFRTAAEPSLLPGRLDPALLGALALRGGAVAGASPSATARRSTAASISTSSRADDERRRRVGRADGPHLSPAAAFLRFHAQILPAGARPPDRAARAAGRQPGARDRLRHGAQPGRARRAPIPTCTSSASTSPPRCSTRRAGVVERAGLAVDIRARPRRCHAFDPALLFGVPGFSRIFVSYSLSMIPGWQAVLARALGLAGAGRRTAHRRFRRPGAACRAGSAPACGGGSACSMSARVTNLEAELTLLGLRPARSPPSSGRTAATPNTRYLAAASTRPRSRRAWPLCRQGIGKRPGRC